MQRNNTSPLATSLDASKRIGIIVARYNSDITYPLRDGARETLIQGGISPEDIVIVEAPGGFEIPFLCQQLAKTGAYDGLIAIGCVIRGDTDHYVYIANESTRGIMDVMLKYDIPIANTLEQAQIRATGDMNKGKEAAQALLEVLCQ